MKTFILMLIVGLLFLILTCSSDQPSAPSEQQSDILAEATIGEEGGTIATDDFILTVPEGAFATTTDLKLYLDQGEKPYEEGAVSGQFHLEGLPACFCS